MAEGLPDRLTSDTDSDCESGTDGPGPAKKSKLGAFRYKTKYSRDWERKWPFLAPVPHDPHRFRYLLQGTELWTPRCI